MRIYHWSFIFVALVPSSAFAETLSAYTAACTVNIGLTTIPSYSCSQGATTGTLEINTPNNRLGRVPTSNPNVDAVFLCRGYDSATNTSDLNAIILHNKINGQTCFFDAKPGTSATVPGPTASNASTFWADPPNMIGECQTCHAGDPFIVTPGLVSAMTNQGMLKKGRNLRGVYSIVSSSNSSSHFYNWNAERLRSAPSCSSSCHFSGNASPSANLFQEAFDEGWMTLPPSGTGYPVSSQTPASIAVWRPGTAATFYFDRDGNRVWNSNIDQWGQFGTTGDMPVVLRGTDCAGTQQRAEFGTKRGTSWYLTTNNHYYDSADNVNTFIHHSGKPASWNGAAVAFSNGSFIVDYNNSRNTVGADYSYPFPAPVGTADKPLVGRWKFGIGHRIGTFRNVNGNGWFYLDINGNNGWDSGDQSFQFGVGSAIPVAGDFNGDGLDEIGVFDNGTWYIDMNNNFQWNGTAGGDAQWSFGQAGDVPVVSPSKWNCSW